MRESGPLRGVGEGSYHGAGPGGRAAMRLPVRPLGAGANRPYNPRSMLPQRALVPLIVAAALFMENLDSTVLSTSLPAIATARSAD